MIEVADFLKKQFGVEVIENKAKQSEWLTWYKNTNGWRNYYVTLANERRSKKKVTRYSLFSCKRVCEDWANLLLNEKTDIVISGNETKDENGNVVPDGYNDLLHEVLEYTDFWAFGNKAIEKVFALGAGAFIVGKDIDDKVTIDFVDATRCYVMRYTGEEVISCAFENTIYIDGKKYTILNVHIKNNDVYEIYNYLFDKDGNLKSDDFMKEKLRLDSYGKSKVKMFSFVTPQNLSKDDWNTPFSDSVFDKAIDANKMIDLAFDSYCNEFILGKKRIFVATELVTYAKGTGKDGKSTSIPVFDENEVAFNLLPEQGNGETLIKEVNMDLRTVQHQSGIQDALNFFASLCGLGEKYYKYELGNITTATQVISENSTLFRNIQKQQISIEKCLKELCQAIFGALDIDIEKVGDISIQFDDSIIEDKEKERARDLIDVDKGIMSKAEYRSKWYGETIEDAQKTIDDIEGREMEKELSFNQGILV